MKFGAHVSMAGGLWNAPANAGELNCDVLQMFSRPPRGGNAKPLTDDVVKRFTDAMNEHGIADAYIHAPYYTNLASGTKRTRDNSVRILREELKRGSLLGCKAVMFHPGSAKDTEAEGVSYVVEGLNRIMDGYEGNCQLLIEISAGAGKIMGDTFEEIAQFLDGAERADDIGICFDTAHAFASGYDLRTKEAVYQTVETFDRIVGLDKLIVSHCNDSKVALGAQKDRHEHLGDGHIGAEGFKHIVQHEALQYIDLILETPNDKKRAADLALLRKFHASEA